ncbi:unnamed protein product [Phytomonas sp. EM1]|nr:unnamed protein product [Phytomonas sp. EM1]|eukprot:CCW63279.1 unnamed protein product [Phytomonas sp. isolate EM1]
MKTKAINHTKNDLWLDVQFYQGLLPVKDAIAARSYVILAADVQDHQSHSEAISLANDMASSFSPPPGNSRDVGLTDSDESYSVKARALCDGISFIMYKKKDVLPPSFMRTLSHSKISCCFSLCDQMGCSCERPHVIPDRWRLQVDTLEPIPLTVCMRGRNIRLSHSNIIPTAGYFFALGLLEVEAVQAVVPTLCRFNLNCKHGCYCLYIHANIDVTSAAVHNADTPLRKWVESNSLNFMSKEEQNDFFDFLSERGVENVGDLQILGDSAFESLLASIPSRWAEAILVTSQLRNFDTKAFLKDVLMTFPRIKPPIQLPDGVQRVGDLLKMPQTLFYHFHWLPHVLNTCEIIRARFDFDEKYKVTRLSKEPADSFLVRVTDIINGFRALHAHCSWRKHNPHRTVVTSILTYVDVRGCQCGLLPPGSPLRGGDEDDDNAFPALPSIPPGAAIGLPERSWCTCARRWEVGVNYELSTPSGSRCSEQNAMGKLASLGVPTWSVRELFVHGSSEHVNPLFPCGVCDNMLQRVAKDVRTRYGGEIRLYMFDATVPSKVVSLPMSEISHRVGSSFRRFVESDLQN